METKSIDSQREEDSEESTTERHRIRTKVKGKQILYKKKKFTGNSHETTDLILPLGSARSLFLHCANAPIKAMLE